MTLGTMRKSTRKPDLKYSRRPRSSTAKGSRTGSRTEQTIETTIVKTTGNPTISTPAIELIAAETNRRNSPRRVARRASPIGHEIDYDTTQLALRILEAPDCGDVILTGLIERASVTAPRAPGIDERLRLTMELGRLV